MSDLEIQKINEQNIMFYRINMLLRQMQCMQEWIKMNDIDVLEFRLKEYEKRLFTLENAIHNIKIDIKNLDCKKV